MLIHRSAPIGWYAHAPETAEVDAVSARWMPCLLASPVPVPGAAVLRARRGRIERLERRVMARPSDRFTEVDMRRRHLTLSPQSIATAEGIDVTVTVAITLRTLDPIASVQVASDADAEVYLAVQVALRDAVARTALDAVLVRDVDVAPLTAAARQAGAGVGIDVESVVLKDVVAPRMLAQAREEAVAEELRSATALERARAEVKATRARLAAAQMLERSPVLARLRLIEAIPPGSHVSLHESGLEASTATPDAQEG